MGGLSGSYSASATATSGANSGHVTIGGVTFGNQYASPTSALTALAGSGSSSTTLLLLGGIGVLAFLIWKGKI